MPTCAFPVDNSKSLMSRVTLHSVPAEYSELFYKNVVFNPQYFGDRVDKKNVEMRIRNFKKIVSGSALIGLKGLWEAQTTEVQAGWFDAASWALMDGWQLFKLDTMYRIYNGIKGTAMPSLYHQFMIGDLYIPPTVNDCIIRQTFAGLPNVAIDWALNMKAALTSHGAGSYATLTFKVHSGYWNDDINNWDEVSDEYDLASFTDWGYINNGYDDGLIAGNYITVEIAVHNMHGHVYLDGGSMWYNDTEFFNDPQFDDCANAWQKITFPAGCTFGSIYPPDTI